MRVKIVGIQNQSYTLDNGYSFTGKKFHAVDLDTLNDNLDGQLVTTFKVASTHPCYTSPVFVGNTYIVYFDQKGQLDFIREE